MEIYKWLNNPMSAINGVAIVKLESGEVSDIEMMLALLDGDSVGHFGVDVKLVSVNVPPEIRKVKHHVEAIVQFGFPNASVIRNSVRYYEVFVHRD